MKYNLYCVIASLPRSGTWWLSESIRSLGYKCTHEHCFSPLHRTYLEVHSGHIEVSWLSVPELYRKPANVKLVHLVRHPVGCINSIINHNHTNFIDKDGKRALSPTSIANPHTMTVANYLLPLLKDDIDVYDSTTVAIWFWYHWNKIIEDADPIYRIRIEDINDHKMLWLIRDMFPQNNTSIGKIRKALNSSNRNKGIRNSELSWGSLPHEVLDMAERYGYGPQIIS